jgi:hypothetical protein
MPRDTPARDDRFSTPPSLGQGTGRPPLPGEPRPGEPDFLARFCAFHGIPYTIQQGEEP